MSALIKARVIGAGNYGRATPGSIVEVTADELARAPWALVSLEDEGKAAEAVQAAEADAEARQAAHERGREMYRAQFEAQKAAMQLRADAEAEASAKRAATMRGDEPKSEEPKAEAPPAPKGKGR